MSVDRQRMVDAILCGETVTFDGRLYRGVPRSIPRVAGSPFADAWTRSAISQGLTAADTYNYTGFLLPDDFPTQADVDAFNATLARRMTFNVEPCAIQKATITHDVTVPRPNSADNSVALGDIMLLRLSQDAAGGHAIDFENNYNLTADQLALIAGDGQAPSATINIEFRRRGATFLWDATFVVVT